jgi:RecB family exonuclease
VGDRIVLSAPHLDIERSLREPSSVILEAAAALGRPNALTGERGRVIPDTAALRRDAFMPAREAALAFRRANPIGEVAWQDAVAAALVGIPQNWQTSLAADLQRIETLREATEPSAVDGLLGAAAPEVSVPGLAPERPISPSALKSLLQCPHLFLLGTLLGFDEPAGAPTQREIGQPAYGSLVHRVAEQFYRTHGERFGARERSLVAWLSVADEVVEHLFQNFLKEYPLVGPAVRNKERERLRGDVRELLEHDWNDGTPRRFIAVERSFGRPTPVRLQAGRRSLYLRGQIDRIDVEGPVAVVRDVKTGRAHPRLGKEAAPDPVLDVQIAIYGLVTQQLAEAWRLPKRVVAAYTYVGRGAEERSWRTDFDQILDPAAREWLAVAAGLLAERSFPRTPNGEDCAYCGFGAICGDDVRARAARLLNEADGPLGRFRGMKSPKNGG